MPALHNKLSYTEIVNDEGRKLHLVGIQNQIQIQVETCEDEAYININKKEVELLIQTLQDWIK